MKRETQSMISAKGTGARSSLQSHANRSRSTYTLGDTFTLLACPRGEFGPCMQWSEIRPMTRIDQLVLVRQLERSSERRVSGFVLGADYDVRPPLRHAIQVPAF